MAAALKVLQAVISVLRDMIENDGKTLGTIVVATITVFCILLFFMLMPVVIHERIPVAMTTEQAVWYWQGAKEVTVMTQSPCDGGVYVDWQEVIAVDTVRLKQNFKKSDARRAKELALEFAEADGYCEV